MPELILPLIRQGTTTLPVNGSITLPKHFDRVEIDATNGDIIFTLPLITHVFRNKPSIQLIRIDSTLNNVTIVGTSGNYADEGFLLGNDPLEESIKIYARNNDTWRKDGYGLREQQDFWASLSAGLISIGDTGDDPTTILTLNKNLAVVGATRVSATEVEFEITNHAQFDLLVGSYFKSDNWTPTAYNITGDVLSLPDSNHVRVTSLSDPVTDADDPPGVWDAGSFNITLGGQYRILEIVNTAVNRFYRRESQIFNWITKSNIDHIAAGTDGNFVVLVDDLQNISIRQLVSGAPVLIADPQNGDPSYNTHVHLATIFKQAGVALDDVFLQEPVNNNIYNKLKNVIDFLPPIKSQFDPPSVVAVGGNLQLDYTGGSFLNHDAGFQTSSGVNPDEGILAGGNPALIALVTRDNVIQSFSTDLNVDDFESSVGMVTAKPNNTASNNYVAGGDGSLFQILGQQTYGPSSEPAADAAVSTELMDLGAIQIPILTKFSITQGISNLTPDGANSVATVISFFNN